METAPPLPLFAITPHGGTPHGDMSAKDAAIASRPIRSLEAIDQEDAFATIFGLLLSGTHTPARPHESTAFLPPEGTEQAGVDVFDTVLASLPPEIADRIAALRGDPTTLLDELTQVYYGLRSGPPPATPQRDIPVDPKAGVTQPGFTLSHATPVDTDGALPNANATASPPLQPALGEQQQPASNKAPELSGTEGILGPTTAPTNDPFAEQPQGARRATQNHDARIRQTAHDTTPGFTDPQKSPAASRPIAPFETANPDAIQGLVPTTSRGVATGPVAGHTSPNHPRPDQGADLLSPRSRPSEPSRWPVKTQNGRPLHASAERVASFAPSPAPELTTAPASGQTGQTQVAHGIRPENSPATALRIHVAPQPGMAGSETSPLIAPDPRTGPPSAPPIPVSRPLPTPTNTASGPDNGTSASDEIHLPAARVRQPEHQVETAPPPRSQPSLPAPAQPLPRVSVALPMGTGQPVPPRPDISDPAEIVPDMMTTEVSRPLAAAPSHTHLAAQSNARQIALQIASAAPQTGNHPIELHLNPKELGKVNLSLSQADTMITVNILAERGETLELMRRHISLLEAEFREIGFDDIRFSFGASGEQADPDDAPGNQPQAAPGHPEADIATPVAAAQPAINANSTDGLDLRL